MKIDYSTCLVREDVNTPVFYNPIPKFHKFYRYELGSKMKLMCKIFKCKQQYGITYFHIFHVFCEKKLVLRQKNSSITFTTTNIHL